MSAKRIVLRRQWIAEHPPIFRRDSKARAAAQLKTKLPARKPFYLWRAEQAAGDKIAKDASFFRAIDRMNASERAEAA